MLPRSCRTVMTACLLGVSLLAACGRAPEVAQAAPTGNAPTGTLTAQAVSGLTSFQHPGIALSRANLDRLRLAVQNRTAPTYSGWNKLSTSVHGSYDYQGYPQANVSVEAYGAKDNGATNMRNASMAAWVNALKWYVTRDARHAQAAVRLMNGYSATLQSIGGGDAKLLAAHTAVRWLNAAELIKHTSTVWSSADQDRFEGMIRNVFYPVLRDFLPTTYDGNWDAALINARLAMGVYLDDMPMFDRGWDYFLNGSGNGAIRNYIDPVTYEVAETCRDQEHTQMGLDYLAGAAEVAHNQRRDDLYSAYNSLLLRGYEFEARYILSKGESATLKRCKPGKTLPDDIADVRAGTIQRYPVWEIMHNHYHDRAGFNTTYSRQIVLEVRAKGGEWENHTLLGYGTALYARP